jgi:hypothetical protein
MMNFEEKIQKELDRHEQQWCDAVCPSVTKFGRQADRRIAALEAENQRLRQKYERLREALMD